MTNEPSLTSWLVEPLDADVRKSIDRLCRAEDVQRVSLMPDVHLAKEVCVGAVVATAQLVYPAAVGSDIGCGMATLALESESAAIDNEPSAARILRDLYKLVPSNRLRKPPELPEQLTDTPLSASSLEKESTRNGRVQLGTLGRGNHFLEFQADQDGQLWVMVHSGSRAMGQAISQHHARRREQPERSSLYALDADEEPGQAYLSDVAWARRYARENRLQMLRAVEVIMQREFGMDMDWSTLIHCDHNHVQCENLDGERLWVHRKGAQSARDGEAGVVPGSMGTQSYHVLGRGCAAAIHSCSHGAGRRLSRSEARRISTRALSREMKGKWFDQRIAHRLVDEAPSAYKDVRAVMRAQRELIKISRQLVPILTYKGV